MHFARSVEVDARRVVTLAYFAAIRHLTDFSSQASKPSVHSSAENVRLTSVSF